MRLRNRAAVVVVATALCVPAVAAAQAHVTSFYQLGDLLKPGDTVWVTDAEGREVKGRIGSLTSETIALEGNGSPAFEAREVRVVQRRGRERGTWIGAGVGAIAGLGAGITMCATYPKDDPLRGDACLMSIGLMWMPGFGAGALVGAMFPGRKQAVYRAPGSTGTAQARVSLVPLITPRAKGVTMAFGF